MSGNNYQKHSFLVFENTQSVLSLQDLEVFKTGAQLPWSFYTVTVSLDNEGVKGNSGGYSKILMTAESKDAGERKAGVAVTKLRTFENGKEKFITAEPGKEITVDDYKACGWPIAYTDGGDAILPSYGEFTFCKGYTPDFEDASQIILNLQIGFGLNGTIYNYQAGNSNYGYINNSDNTYTTVLLNNLDNIYQKLFILNIDTSSLTSTTYTDSINPYNSTTESHLFNF